MSDQIHVFNKELADGMRKAGQTVEYKAKVEKILEECRNTPREEMERQVNEARERARKIREMKKSEK